MSNAGELSENVRKKLMLLADKKYYYLVLTLNDFIAKGEKPNVTQLLNAFQDKYISTGICDPLTERTGQLNIERLIDEGIIRAELNDGRGKWGEKALELDSGVQDSLLTVDYGALDTLIEELKVETNTEDKIVLSLSFISCLSITLVIVSMLFFDMAYLRELTVLSLCFISSLLTSMVMLLVKVRYDIERPLGRVSCWLKNLAVG